PPSAFMRIGVAGRDARTFRDHGARAAAPYTYRVRALTAAGPSEYSGEVTVMAAAAGSLSVRPPTVAFGTIRAHGSREHAVLVKNRGAGTLTGTVIAPGAAFSIP